MIDSRDRLKYIIVILLLLAVASILIGIWSFNKNANSTLAEGVCIITSNNILAKVCRNRYGDWTCYNLNINVTLYDINNQIIAKQQKVAYGPQRTNKEYIEKWRDKNAYIGLKLQCFYKLILNNNVDEYAIQFKYDPEPSVFIASMVFFGLSAAVFVVWIIVEIYNCATNPYRYNPLN